MVNSNMPSADSFLSGARLAVTVGLAILLSACTALGIKSSDPTRNPKDTVVRIVAIEPGAPENAHPFNISVEALQQTLAKLKVKGSLTMDAVPVFASEELPDLASKMVAALEKAGPKEDVTFAASASHGLLGSLSPKTVTTGRAFVRDTRLNIIFGIMHETTERSAWEGDAVRGPIPGSRKAPIEAVWSVVPDGARLAEKRSDWVMLDIAAAPLVATPPVATPPPAAAGKTGSASPAVPTAPPTATTTDDRVHAIQEKLQVLERLKARGLITDEEYRERRRAILQGI